MKMRTLSKKILALFLTLAMLVSCMVWAGASAVSADYTVFTCNFDTMPVKSSYGSGGNAPAGYAPNSTDGSGDNTVAGSVGKANYIVEMGANGVIDDTPATSGSTAGKGDGIADVTPQDDNGYMRLTGYGSTTGMSFRLYGDRGSWKNKIDGVDVTGNADESRAQSGIRYRCTFDYRLVVATADVDLAVFVQNDTLQGGHSGNTANTERVLSIAPGDEATDWQTVSVVFTAKQSYAMTIGMIGKTGGTTNSTTGTVVDVDNIIVEYVPDSRLATYTLDDTMGGTTTFNACRMIRLPPCLPPPRMV